MATFKVKDLMINVIPREFRGGGATGLCSIDQATAEYTPITPHTPVVMVANLTPKFEALRKVENLDGEQVNQLVTEVGQAVLAGGALSYCTQDMATCDAGQWWSRFARTDLLHNADLPQLKLLMQDAVRRFEETDSLLENRAREERGELVPLLEDALGALR